MMNFRTKRNSRGVALAETASTLALLLPFLFVVALVTIQASGAYMAHTALTQAALEAAHDLGAVWAAQNQPNQPLSDSQQQAVFGSIVIPVSDPFGNTGSMNPMFTSAQFNFAANPPSVTTTAVYIPGASAFNKRISTAFANWIMPAGFQLRSSCTYPLPVRSSTVSQ